MVERIWKDGEHRIAKKIYKAQYIFDIELTEDLDDPDKVERNFGVKATHARFTEERYTGVVLDQVNARFDYVEKHFPKAVLALYNRMLEMETLPLFTKFINVRDEFRGHIIRNIIKDVRADVDDRIPVARGRKPNKLKSTWEKEKSDFEADLIETLKDMHSNEQKLTRTAAAGGLEFLQNFRNKLKEYEVDFVELVKKIKKELPSN